MEKKLTITVGIPAYNEQFNIKKLLRMLIVQRHSLYALQKIIVVSDASTDRTDKLVRTLRNKRIQFITNRRRMGQIYCQNKIFSLVKTDLIVLLEADTLPKNERYMDELIKPFYRNSSIGLVQGNIKALKPKTFLERILNAQSLVFRKFTMDRERNIEYFASGRGGRVFAKKVYNKLVWPAQVPEDIYALLWCRQRNIKTAFAKKAICLYRRAQTFSDYMRERKKIVAGEKAMKAYMPSRVVLKAYRIPLILKLKMVCYFLITSPVFFFSYIFLQFALKKALKENRFTNYWSPTATTKRLGLS